MTDATTTRFEATAIVSAIGEECAFLTMQTDQGRIAVYMQWPVFEALFQQMKYALDQVSGANRPTPKP